MEGSPLTERTLAVYRRLRGEFDNVGIVIQAYLHRSQADVEALIADGIGHFRLCKGAYDEPASIAYRERPRVTQALNELIRTCLAPPSRDQGRLLRRRLARRRGRQLHAGLCLPARRPATAYEFQMLYGIRRELQAKLAQDGYACASMCPTAPTGIPTSCAAWPSVRPTCSSSCARSWETRIIADFGVRNVDVKSTRCDAAINTFAATRGS